MFHDHFASYFLVRPLDVDNLASAVREPTTLAVLGRRTDLSFFVYTSTSHGHGAAVSEYILGHLAVTHQEATQVLNFTSSGSFNKNNVIWAAAIQRNR